MSIQKHNQYIFQEQITCLSLMKDYPNLLEEWEISSVEQLEKDQTGQSCICGFSPIRKVYQIADKKTGKTAFVGKYCAENILSILLQNKMIELSECKKFPELLQEWELDSVQVLKEGTTSICGDVQVQKVCRIKNNRNGHTATVDQSCVHKYFECDNNFKDTHKIFDAFNKIKKDINKSANIELINYAFEKKILSASERDFYHRIWRKTKLSELDRKDKIRLNNRIIQLVSQQEGSLNNVKRKLADFYYIYGSGLAQPNRKIEFWEKAEGKTVARVFALVNGKYEKIRKIDGKNIIVEKNSTTDRKKAIEAQKQNRQFVLQPDSNLNKISSEERRNILGQLNPMGPWKVAIQPHIGKSLNYEKIIRITLFDAS